MLSSFTNKVVRGCLSLARGVLLPAVSVHTGLQQHGLSIQRADLPRQPVQVSQQQTQPPGHAWLTLQLRQYAQHARKDRKKNTAARKQQRQQVEGPGGILAESAAGKLANQLIPTLLSHQFLADPEGVIWAQLHDHGFHSTRLYLLGKVFNWVFCRGLFAARCRSMSLDLDVAHADHDWHSFRLGVVQALQHTTQLYQESRWDKLKPLVSQHLMSCRQEARQAEAQLMADKGLSLTHAKMAINPDAVNIIISARCTAEVLYECDTQRFADRQREAGKVCWDVVHVHAEGVLHTRVFKGGALQYVDLPKSGNYLLCRGPVLIDQVLKGDEAEVASWICLSWN